MRILRLMFLLQLAALQPAFADPSKVTIITGSSPRELALADAIATASVQSAIQQVIANDCPTLGDKISTAYAAASNATELGLVVAARCGAAAKVASDRAEASAAKVPTVVIGRPQSNLDGNLPKNILILVTPSPNPQLSSSIQEMTGAPSGIGNAGYCDSPEMFVSDRIGPIWSCIERDIDTVSNLTVQDSLGITARALISSYPGDSSPFVVTPFGTVRQPWVEQSYEIPGATIIDADHSTIKNTILKRYIPNDDLFGFLCPDCSGSGYICGDTCPSSCGGNCSNRNGKQCCRGDGNVAPLQ